MKTAIGVRITGFFPASPAENEAGIAGRINGNFDLASTPFSFEKHGRLIHKWCNKPYSARFWNMAGSYEDFVSYYQDRLSTAGVELTIFTVNSQPVAFAETYPVIGSPLHPHIPEATDRDLGIHFLMAPPRKLAEAFGDIKRALSFFTLIEAVVRLFRSGRADTVYAEPDKENSNACHLAATVGFRLVKEIRLPEKTALLMQYKKEDIKFKQ